MSDLAVRPVASRADRAAFLAVPEAVYAGDPAWIAPLRFERARHISPRHNPFFEHAEVALFLAERGGRPVGRISAQVDRLRLERHGDATGLFGFLEGPDDAAVFAALLAAAEAWLAARGMRRALGPFSFSINEETGLLVSGFEHPPAVMTGHARPWHGRHVEAAGYTKAKDVLAYRYDAATPLPRAMAAMVGKATAAGELAFRPLDKRHLARDLAILIDIFNDAWSGNWGFVPFTAREIDRLGSDLKLLVEGGFVVFAEHRGEPAAMAVTLPDVNAAIADLGGRLTPVGLAKLLWRLKARPPAAVRLPLMGVRKAFHATPLGTAMAAGLIDTLRRYHLGRGTRRGELSWILEDNLPMRRLIEAVGGEPYKTYRVYERALDGAAAQRA